MDNKNTNTKKDYAKIISIAILYLVLCGVVFDIFSHIQSGDSVRVLEIVT